MEQRRPTLHLRRLLSALALAVTCATPAAATPLCLPPLFEGGQRLHSNPAPRSSWLDPALRQHALCWSAARHPDTLRVAVIGNSAVFGLPHPARDVFTSQLNDRLHAAGIDASLFNLGWVSTYQLRDALLLDAALAYEPDVIVYPVTLAEYVHVAPSRWPILATFFRTNRDALAHLIAEDPPGLGGVLDVYSQSIFNWEIARPMLEPVRIAGTFVRAATAALGAELPALLGAQPAPAAMTRRRGRYDCVTVAESERKDFSNWQDWNILAYLAAVRDRTGIPVLVVNWPVAHDPQGDCYNYRFTSKGLAEFNDWLRRDTSARHLPLVDLSEALSPADFIDTLHPTVEGHRAIAARLYDPLTGLLADARARRGAAR